MSFERRNQGSGPVEKKTFKGVNIWNNCSDELRKCGTLYIFKNCLKNKGQIYRSVTRMPFKR